MRITPIIAKRQDKLAKNIRNIAWKALVSVLNSSGMRLLEGLRLRVKDVDFERHEIAARPGLAKTAH